MRRRSGAPLLAAAALLVIGAAPAHAQIGLISQSQELEAGRQADRQILSKYRVSRDPRLNSMVQSYGRRLAAVSERPNLPWTFRVLESNEINAFSVPGFVYINTGLINAARGDQEAIAAVIAHEIAHTTGKHAVKQMEKGAIGDLLLGLLGARSNRTVSALAGIAANLVMLGYSRDDENDADARAVRYLDRAGIDPNGLVRFFQMLEARGDRGGGGLLTYFRTHPPTGNRIERVRSQIARLGASGSSYSHRSRPEDRYYDDRYYDDRQLEFQEERRYRPYRRP